MTKSISCLLIIFAVFSVVPTLHAQWWGSETLPGNPNYYTYRTRLGNWQYGASVRNITTSPKFADRGIIRNWNNGSPIAVDRNLPGGRFEQRGVPHLVYVPQIDYYDKLGYLTDVEFRSGLRQYWPEDYHLLFHEWEQKTYEPERLPVNSAQVTSAATISRVTSATSPTPRAAVQEPRYPIQTVVIQQLPAKPPQRKETQSQLTYHERVMQGHVERRAAEEERNRQYAQRLADQSTASSQTNSPYQVQQQPMSVDPLWFRDQVPPQTWPLHTATGSQADFGMSGKTYTIPFNPAAEREKRLEYALAASPEITFYSPFQTKFDNGTVTVTGIVGSKDQRLTAERILLIQPDVQLVHNLLTVNE